MVTPGRARPTRAKSGKEAPARAVRKSPALAVQLPPPVPAAYEPIRTPRISEEIGARIRQQIASGDLKPNDRLPTERELSEMFAVSRMAVREGMRNLEVAGLITLKKGRSGGAFVADGGAKLVTQSFRDMIDLGRASVDMLLEARLHVMDTVVRLACRRARPAHLAALEKNLAEAVALTEQGRFEERTYKAIEFNRLLAEATGNVILTAMVGGLSEVLRHFVALAGPRVHDPVLTTRRTLLDQIRARNEEAAARTMETYLRGLQAHLEKARRPAERPPAEARAR